MAAIPPNSLSFIINHVVLPPQLPHAAEDCQDTRVAERDLIGLLSTQLKTYRGKVDPQSSSNHAVWASIESMLDICTLLISTHVLTVDLLVHAFQSLEISGESRGIALEVFELTCATRPCLDHPYLSQSSKCGAYSAQK